MILGNGGGYPIEPGREECRKYKDECMYRSSQIYERRIERNASEARCQQIRIGAAYDCKLTYASETGLGREDSETRDMWSEPESGVAIQCTSTGEWQGVSHSWAFHQ